jgi:hypothetical protein
VLGGVSLTSGIVGIVFAVIKVGISIFILPSKVMDKEWSVGSNNKSKVFVEGV